MEEEEEKAERLPTPSKERFPLSAQALSWAYDTAQT